MRDCFKTILTEVFFLVLLALTTGANAVQDEAETDSLNAYENLFDQLINLQVDPDKFIRIENFTFQRDAAQFSLREGEWYFCQPVKGQICAAVFLGDGKFHFSPSTQIERDHLNRFFKRDSLEEEFKFLFVLFADSTFEEFERSLPIMKGSESKVATEQIEYALKYMGDKKQKSFNYDVMKTLLDGERNGLFYAHFSDKKYSPLFYSINPFESEEVRFMRRPAGESITHTTEVINQFHRQGDYSSGIDLSEKNNSPIDVIRYDLDCRIEGNLDFSATAEVHFRSRKDRQRWIYFWLHPDLKVDSVLWGGQPESGASAGRKIPYNKGDKSSLLWIEYPLELSEGDSGSFTVCYQGNIIEREIDWVYLKSSQFWYPRHSLQDRSLFNIRFQTPPKYRFACSGIRQAADTTDEWITSSWITERATRSASFNIGVFKVFSVERDTVPAVTVFMADAAHNYMRRRQGIIFAHNMDKEVAADIVGSLAFFDRVFGDYPMQHFYATEIPFVHGQAFQGLIHLSWLTFLNKGEEGHNEIFRAHEVAHQWWGIGVDFKTYHDQWLSEGFAHFAGLWYMQQKLKDERKYFKVLEDWGKEILNVRKYILGSGQEAGPIWLGYRTQSSATPGDYGLIIYKKGAWVLHALRMMMMDLETKSDSAFIAMMRDFYRTYLHQTASTEDFQGIVEKHLGQDMQWFFDQWIYSVEIPTYKYAYKIEESCDGKYTLRLRVRQEDVSAHFRMPVLLGMEASAGETYLERIVVEGEASEFVFPDLELRPKKIIFNGMQSVLAKVKKEGW